MTKSLVSPLATAANVKPQSTLLDTEAAAEYIGVAPRSLEVWRCVKRHSIPYIKVGRLVKYRQSDLDAWLESRTVGAAV
ncbi:MAG: helix-turn-helix domain-containing protein [Sulfurimicrobium sp.]|nr:helix-turn-helix domain-containing protein [Sulfurimicrobium sp.]